MGLENIFDFWDPMVGLLGDHPFFKKAGPTTLPVVSPQQEGFLNSLMQYLGNNMGQSQGSNDIYSILSGNSPLTQSLTSTLTANAMRDFQQFTKPAINEQFAGVGGILSSRRNSAIAGAGVQAQQGVTNLLPQLIEMQLRGVQAADQMRWNPVQLGAGLATSPTRGITQDPAGPGWDILGGIMGGIGAAFSDRRLKVDVRATGLKYNGLMTYRFFYVWGGLEQIGVMADEAEKLYPHAVYDGWGGFRVVNYAQLREINS